MTEIYLHFFKILINIIINNGIIVMKKIIKNIKIDKLIPHFRKGNIEHLNSRIKPWFVNFNTHFNINIFSRKFDNMKKI